MYEYYLDRHDPPLCWVFQARTGPTGFQPCQVCLEPDGLAAWELQNRTQLRQNERYAVAKLALFRTLDEGSPVFPALVSAEEIGEILNVLELR